MSLSYIAKTIGESATLRLNETAAILRAKGDPVIHLGGGEPKGKAPLDAILAATSLLNSGRSGTRRPTASRRSSRRSSATPRSTTAGSRRPRT
jgi:aspartate aminotransferase